MRRVDVSIKDEKDYLKKSDYLRVFIILLWLCYITSFSFYIYIGRPFRLTC